MLTQARHRGPSSHIVNYLLTEKSKCISTRLQTHFSKGHLYALARKSLCHEMLPMPLELRNNWTAEQVRGSCTE